MTAETFIPTREEELRRWTSLRLGGPARFFCPAGSADEVEEALRWAADHGRAARILGGGSNLVVADSGVADLVIRMANLGVTFRDEGDDVLVWTAAGESWDEVVAASVEHDLTGLECLSGIPGTAGATPIQNVGAYGVEIADVLEEVEVLDRSTFKRSILTPGRCSLRYRGSRFKDETDRFVVLGVSFRLRRKAPVRIAYPELARALETGSAEPTPREVRETVLRLRRSKGMVLDDDALPNVGSFFVNPVLSPAEVSRIVDLVGETPPAYPVEGEGVKVPAAWLIERSGVAPGLRRGPVGVSPHHALALVHHGGGKTADLVSLAGDIRSAVKRSTGVELRPEPVFWGFGGSDPLDQPAGGAS